MAQSGTSIAAVLEKFAEFDRTATVLKMPRAERLNILNISNDTYAVLRSAAPGRADCITPEIERRLSYALPLMRRLAKTSQQPQSASSSTDLRLQAA